jgi:AcrR family transcriptional regulator
VSAAAALVRQRGSARTSLDDVLAASRTSKSQLYHYFTDKDDLLRAVAQHQTELVMNSERPELDTIDSFAALVRWRDRIVADQDKYEYTGGCPLGSMANELADGDPQTRAVLQQCFAQWEAPLRDGFTAMRDKGKLKPSADPSALAEAVMAALQGGLLLTKTYRTSRPLARALDMAIANVRSHAARRI